MCSSRQILRINNRKSAYILTRFKKVGAFMQINKGNITLKEQIACMNASVLTEGDVILSDNCPDISEILCADAKVLSCDVEYKNSKAKVTGVVEFFALFMPDGMNTELECVSRELEFSYSFDVKADDECEFSAAATAEHIGFTLVNSRKISSKIMIGIKLCALCEKCYEPIISADGDDIEKIDKNYNIYIPVSETCTDISLNDLLQIPDAYPDVAKILKIDSWVTSGDMRIMNGKVMVQGELHLNTLYVAANDGGATYCVHHTVPFTEIAEAPGADEASTVNVSFEVREITSDIKGDLNGDTKIISIESVICACVKVSKTVSETLVDDCYFLDSATETKYDTMKVCEYITSEKTKIATRQSAELPKGTKIKEIVSCSGKPILKEVKWEDGSVKLSGVLVTYLIYRDEKNQIRCSVNESEVNWEKTVSEPCVVDGNLSLYDIKVTDDGIGAEILTETEVYMKALRSKEAKILVDCEKKEDENKKAWPAMVVYFARAGETVWEIAKKYRTKPHLIKDANGLETEKIEKGKRLLIPMA